MSFDRDALIKACARHGTIARVVIATVKGSAPREIGTSMLVWQDGQSGTIGGGTLEHMLSTRARRNLTGGTDGFSRHALGPELGQCCGGAVEILTEFYDLERAQNLPQDVIVRGDEPEPVRITKLRSQLRNGGQTPRPVYLDGWMVEPVSHPARHLWIWGAGHVGRALVTVIHPLPDIQITWIDTQQDRFPDRIPENVTQVCARNPAELVRYAPHDGEHLIVTYSHALDMDLCHGLLSHGFTFAGLIGSATKWARFRKRLGAFGHTPEQIDRITCPIGRPALGKHPHMIALGVAAGLLEPHDASITAERTHA